MPSNVAAIQRASPGGKHPPLHLGHDLAGAPLIPVPVEVLGHGTELDDQVCLRGRRVRFRLASPAKAVAGLPHRRP